MWKCTKCGQEVEDQGKHQVRLVWCTRCHDYHQADKIGPSHACYRAISWEEHGEDKLCESGSFIHV